MGENYSQFEKLMSNYKFNYISYIVLLLIILVNTIRAYNYYQDIKQRDELVNFNFFDISVSIIAFVGIISTILFHGEISEISENYGDTWLRFDTIILFVSAAFLGLQSFILLKKNKKEKLAKKNKEEKVGKKNKKKKARKKK